MNYIDKRLSSRLQLQDYRDWVIGYDKIFNTMLKQSTTDYLLLTLLVLHILSCQPSTISSNGPSTSHTIGHSTKQLSTICPVPRVTSISPILRSKAKPLQIQTDQSSQSLLSTRDLAFSGAFATMIGDIALHPIDCIKTFQQSNNGMGFTMVGATKHILQNHGIGGLFNGLGPYVLSDACAGAIKFASYEALKRWVHIHVSPDYVGSAIFGCAALAFLASSVVLVPGELIKQRLQMNQAASIGEGITNIWKTEGVKGLFTGYTGVCLRDIPYTMLELGLYDTFKRAYVTVRNRKSDKKKPLSQIDEILAAAVTGGITGYLTNPLDLIKTKLMVDTTLYTGFHDCLIQTLQQKGIPSLFQGGCARVAWLMPFTAIYLPVYDFVKRQMKDYRQRKYMSSSKNGINSMLQVKGGLAIKDTPNRTYPYHHLSVSTRRYTLDGKDKRCFISF